MIFAILNHPNGGVVPLVDDNEQVCTFDTRDEAKQAIYSNMLGHAYGGKVFDTEEDGEDV